MNRTARRSRGCPDTHVVRADFGRTHRLDRPDLINQLAKAFEGEQQRTASRARPSLLFLLIKQSQQDGGRSKAGAYSIGPARGPLRS
jgi:hypothetical protein